MLPETLGYIFDDALGSRPSAPAVLQGYTTLTYAELDGRCNKMANVLAGLGVGSGDRVALMFQNDFRFLDSCFGPMRLGAVPVPLNIRMGDEALAFVLADSSAEVLIASSGMVERARRIAARTPAVTKLIFELPQGVGSGARDGAVHEIDYAEAMSGASNSLPRRKLDPDDVCMQPYTSGSTGKPKGVLLTHRGQIWNTDVLRRAHQLNQDERALVAVPLYHKNAMIGTVKPFLLVGGSFVILEGFEPKQVIQAIERYRVTFMTGVPAMFKMILAEGEALSRHDVGSIRYALVGSAEVPEELLSEFEDVFGAKMAESYGLTEGGPVPVINTRDGDKRLGSCGKAFDGCHVKLVGEDGVTEVGPDEPGELVTRNPGLAKGYWNRPDATAEKFRDGWLHTGDVMRQDVDGFFYFLGRNDDMISVAGENVYPKEVEDILLRHPNIRDACVVPMPHSVKGAVPVAFVVEREPGVSDETELKAFFLERGAPYAHPRRAFIVDALPLGGTGKIDRTALAERAAEEAARES